MIAGSAVRLDRDVQALGRELLTEQFGILAVRAQQQREAGLVRLDGSHERLLGIEREVGTLEAGKAADLLIIDGNPLRRLGLLMRSDRLAGVMRNGQFVAGELTTEK